jgi:hypothetical protein
MGPLRQPEVAKGAITGPLDRLVGGGDGVGELEGKL